VAETESGGRTWWAHSEVTRMNIAPTILRKEIEDAREAGGLMSRPIVDYEQPHETAGCIGSNPSTG
jgi:hypothetical protein